ncbi:MAG TPA: porin [Gemmatimonadota bacterium]|nr:porin [Gemmatimonadota bacterium]
MSRRGAAASGHGVARVRKGTGCRWIAAAALVLACAAPQALRAQEEQPDVTVADGATLKLEVLAQPQMSTTSVDSALQSDYELRRARLTAEGTAGDRWSGRIQMDFEPERARFRDAYLEGRVSDALSLRAGQFKVPFNGFDIESGKRLIAIERGARVRGTSGSRISTSGMLAATALSARNRGIMALSGWADGRVRLQAGAWIGSGERGETNDGKQLAARLELEPWAGDEERLPLVLAAAVVTNGYFGSPQDTLVVAGGDSAMTEDAAYATAFEGWVELGRYAAPGIHVAGNVVAGNNPLAPRVEGSDVRFASFLGMQVWGEYVFRGTGALTGIGLGGRVDRFDPDTDADEDAFLLWTPLVNLYFGKAFKLQANVDLLSPESEERDRESAVRIQAQVVL